MIQALSCAFPNTHQPIKAAMTQDELKKLLHYCPITGAFTWVTRPSNRVKIGDVAGFIATDSYVFIRIAGTLYYAHRLAFLYMTGAWPADLVDHDNHTRSDNRWSNLKAANSLQNTQNAALSKNSTSGINGVLWDTRKKKWMAHITINHKKKFLGYFDEIGAAASARKAADSAFGFHPNHGITTI